MTEPTIAVLLPCYNEEAAIAQTIAVFRAALPGATIYVYDNNSRDRTVEVAKAAGAIVRTERVQGKGAVVRRMFADVDADIYVMADGDATYDATSAPGLVAHVIDEQLDMVVGARRHEAAEAYRAGHVLGNRMMTGMLARLFGTQFLRHFLRLPGVLAPVREVVSGPLDRVRDRDRDVGACARTGDASGRDGHPLFRAAGRVGVEAEHLWRRLADHAGNVTLYRIERPRGFYGLGALVLFLTAVILAIPLAITYVDTGLVPRLPTAILATGLVILASLSFFAGLILDTVVRVGAR